MLQWPVYVLCWPQVLSQGFPSKMKTYYLQRFRDNLSSFQSLRWDHYWKLHVLPIISPPQWIDKQNHHWLFPVEQTIVICTVHSHLDLCRLIFQFAASYFTGYGPRFELSDVYMCVCFLWMGGVLGLPPSIWKFLCHKLPQGYSSLVTSPRAPSGEKRSGERSRISWPYYPKA